MVGNCSGKASSKCFKTSAHSGQSDWLECAVLDAEENLEVWWASPYCMHESAVCLMDVLFVQ